MVMLLDHHCKSILRKASGKLLVNSIKVKFNDHVGMLLLKDDDTVSDAAKGLVNDIDPTSNLTFNLRLTDKEKQARADTALPYLLDDTRKTAYLEKTNTNVVSHGGGGNVTYMPDEADDFDDEDPDDDLDF